MGEGTEPKGIHHETNIGGKLGRSDLGMKIWKGVENLLRRVDDLEHQGQLHKEETQNLITVHGNEVKDSIVKSMSFLYTGAMPTSEVNTENSLPQNTFTSASPQTITEAPADCAMSIDIDLTGNDGFNDESTNTQADYQGLPRKRKLEEIEHEESEREIRDLKARIAAMEGMLHAAEIRATSAEKRNTKLMNKLKDMNEDNADLKERCSISDSLLKEARSLASEAQTKQEICESRLEDSDQKNTKLNDHIKSYELLFKKTKGQFEEAEENSIALENELRKTEAKNARLLEKIKSYKELLSKSEESTFKEVMDSSIASDFVDLKNQIQNIVTKFFHLDPDVGHQELQMLPCTILGYAWVLWGSGYNKDKMRKRLRGLLFNYIHKSFFETPSFGLRGDTLDEALADFEKKAASKIDNKALTEWKNRTIEIASSLQNANDKINRFTQEALEDLLPYMHLNPSYECDLYDIAVSDLEGLLLKLLTDANKLAMLLRRSKYNWKILEHNEGEVPSPNEIVVYEVQSSRGVPTEKIDFVISGGLYKITDPKEGKTILLVKEDVVMQTTD
ncbi:hypothetical protein HYFRA_00008448 [Hymenoscyphus fraxineus]|uniref:Uncharacterized protein n=1 Tax=Hymenoscyphus fraxineus TaxID=746836 RepID=A0A9N9PNP8_9HELO|nr:hypothetical protein HYFRA_00008448 [Hymenoscyphus fraxineus]